MTKKRKSGGRSGGSRGRATSVQCSNCGRTIPADKAKKKTKYVSVVDPRMAKELRDAGAILPRRRITQYYCISCAVHFGQVNPRDKSERKR